MTFGRRIQRSTAATSLVLATLVVAGGCSSSPKAAAEDFTVETAGYDLALGPPARFIAGVLLSDRNSGVQKLVGFGTAQMRFRFLAPATAGQSPAPTPAPGPAGPPQTASFVTIAGTTPPVPLPKTPRVVSASQGRGVYAVTTAFDKPGSWQVEVSLRLGSQLKRGTSTFAVADRHHVPAPGMPALTTENLTLASTSAPRAAIDSRASGGDIPDSELHGTTIAAAVAAHRPAVVVFSTPTYCQSQFCGPITDMVQQLSHDYGDRASFIHVEIWQDFQNKRLNAAAADWLTRDGADGNEPWVFVIGADGHIVARFDNVVTRGDVEGLLRPLPVVGPAA